MLKINIPEIKVAPVAPAEPSEQPKNPLRNYCFTYYGVGEEGSWNHKDIDWEVVSYLIVNVEHCPETHRKHYQCYVEFNKTRRITAAQKALNCEGRSWFSVRRGTAAQAQHYCMKPVPGCPCPHCVKAAAAGEVANYEEWGTISKGQGTRTDLDSITAEIIAGKDVNVLALENGAHFARYNRGMRELEQIVTYNAAKAATPDPGITLRPWQEEIDKYIGKGFVKRQILWVWSQESGTGKSTYGDHLMWKYGPDYVQKGSFTKKDLLRMIKAHKVIWFNIERDEEINRTHLKVLENISDGGWIASEKYEPCVKPVYCTVLVTSNLPPPRRQLPKRIISWCLDDKLPIAKCDDSPSSVPYEGKYGQMPEHVPYVNVHDLVQGRVGSSACFGVLPAERKMSLHKSDTPGLASSVPETARPGNLFQDCWDAILARPPVETADQYVTGF